MDLVVVGLGIGIAANLGTIAETKGLTALLTDVHTVGRARGTVTLTELVGIGVRGDGRPEIFGGAHLQILDVVRVKRGGVGPGRRLLHTGQPVPAVALVIRLRCGVERIYHAPVHAGFIQALAGFVPFDFRHFECLPSEFVHR